MVKNTQRIRRQQPTNCLSVIEHSVGLALKGLKSLDDHESVLRNSAEIKGHLEISASASQHRHHCNINRVFYTVS